MNQISQNQAAAGTNVVTQMVFITPQQEKPVFYSQAYTGGDSKELFQTERREVTVADMRPLAGSLDIDREGFTLKTEPTEVDLHDDAAVGEAYYAEIEALLTREFGASRVAIFDATRRSDGGGGGDNPDGKRAVAVRVHVDYTTKSGPQRARDVLGEAEYDRLIANGARIVQVNVWRPITGPVRRSPLALADARSIPVEDLIATEQVFPDRVGEIYLINHNPEHLWYWAPEMTTDEVLLIKGWDSLNDGRARFTPHGAFPLPDQDAAPARESIEIRTLVVIE